MPSDGIVERCASLVEAMVDAMNGSDAEPVEVGSERLLDAICDAVGVRTAALLSRDRESTQVVRAVSVGEGGDEVVRALTRTCASGGEASWWHADDDLRLRPIEGCELRLPTGVMLLGVTLPPRGETVTLLTFGVAESSPDERERLTTRWNERANEFVDCLQILRGCARLAQTVQTLRQRQEARTRMVSLVAHDVRGSLSTAKLAAQLLGHDTKASPGNRQLAEKIDGNIDRTERLLRDLLDANRVHAGRALFVRRERGDLTAAVAAVAERLRGSLGDRFVVEAPGAVVGDWDTEQLQRVIWNLASLAAGSDTTSRTSIRVIRDGARVRLVVHPVPFDAAGASALSARTELCLALARGGAQAHGGHLELHEGESEAAVTLILPIVADDASDHQGARGPVDRS
jgi:signal transduction histidine kinase